MVFIIIVDKFFPQSLQFYNVSLLSIMAFIIIVGKFFPQSLQFYNVSLLSIMVFIIIVDKFVPNPYSFTMCPYYQSWHLLYLLLSFFNGIKCVSESELLMFSYVTKY